MKMLALVSAALALALASSTGTNAVYAQKLTPCLAGCIDSAGSEAGCSATDVSCMCGSGAFKADMLACVKAKCTPADLAAAEQFEAEFCGGSS